MKLSEVIKRMKELKKEYGDVEVTAGIECKNTDPDDARDPFEVIEQNGVRNVVDVDGIPFGEGMIVFILSDKLQTY